MDRSPRLRRYDKKDYTQRVEFPVEIVGRDNQVRRYAFDDAIQLYHRRIETAPARYADPDTIEAETRHCTQRIAQLRRSYIAAGGGAVPTAGEGILAGPLAADVLFFLRRVLGEAAESAAATLVSLDRGPTETWWCQAAGRPGAVLYAFRLDAEGPPAASAALERVLGRLRMAANEPGAERLYVGVVTRDIGLLLAGAEPWPGPHGLLAGAPRGGAEAGEETADPWHAAMVALGEGQPGLALRRLEAALDEHPTRRILARAAAVVAHLADEPERAEFIARFGLVEAPDDRLLGYLLALAESRRGQPLDLAAPRQGPMALLGGLVALERGQLVAALRGAAAAGERIGDNEWFAVRAGRALRWAALTQLAVRGSAALGVSASVAVATLAGPTWTVAALPFVALALAGEWRTRRAARRGLREARYAGVRLCPPELLPKEGGVILAG